jgi:class 3 adenylate cyclase
MQISLVGISHKTAPVAVREHFAFVAEELPQLLARHDNASRAAAKGEHVRVRIGLHAGETIKDGDDFCGKNVILVSRVAGKAAGGEILVSSLVHRLVESSVGAALFGAPREVGLKGLSGTHTVFAVAST